MHSCYVFCPDPANDDYRGMWHCNQDTNVWRPVHNIAVEKEVADALMSHPELSRKEVRFTQSKRGRQNLRCIMAGEVLDKDYTFEARLDSQLDLFPFENGAFDMADGGRMVPILPEHMVSKTTGWFYDADLARAKRPEVEAFLRCVLPVDEERHAALSYVAGLLSGHRTAKRFMVLTDKRSGNNGKSTFAALVRMFFGAFASCKGTKFVTRPAVDRGDRNAHDAGLVKCKGLRVMVAEELKKHLQLDEGFLKMLTGGAGVEVEGRRLGKEDEVKFTWTAGFMLVFNEGDCPKADIADDAFWARAMVVPFRSKFLPAAELAQLQEAGDAEPDSFPVDTEIVKSFPTWMSALADILLEMYPGHCEALYTLPLSMRDWKSEVQTQNNPLTAWLEERYEVTGNRAVDKVAFTASMGFDAPTPTFMADIKAYFTALGCWKAKDSVKMADGSWKTGVRNVAVGVRTRVVLG